MAAMEITSRMLVKDVMSSPVVTVNEDELVREARLLIDVIASFDEEGSLEPLTNPKVYVKAVKMGVLDAPNLRNNPIARGKLKTRMIDGACFAIDPDSGEPITEKQRLELLGLNLKIGITLF